MLELSQFCEVPDIGLYLTYTLKVLHKMCTSLSTKCRPILLGGGKSLFGELETSKEFQLIDTKVLSDMLVQSHYKKT